MSATTARAEALERANAVRRERMRLLGGGYGTKLPPEQIADLIVECPPALANMEMLTLLGYVQGYGTRRTYADHVLKAERLLHAEKISTNRKLGSLSERQRGLIARRLRGIRSLGHEV